MIELLVTCILSGVFIPPLGWTVVEAFVKPPYSTGMTLNMLACFDRQGSFIRCPDPEPYVKLMRTMKIGEIVETPKGCTIQAVQKEDK